jgi:protein subunit release factor A
VETLILEIRAAEGGNHAQRLVRDQLNIYLKAGARRCL